MEFVVANTMMKFIESSVTICRGCFLRVCAHDTARSPLQAMRRARLATHRCPAAVTPQTESHEEMRLRCWESGFATGCIEGRCPCCHGSRIRCQSTSGTTFQMMHVVPRALGGASASWNLLPGCGCNQNMAQMNLLDWMGTRGNKRHLLRPLLLKKYKSLVPPAHRSRTDRQQVIEWVRARYAPKRLAAYEAWLLLLESDLRRITR